MFCFSLRLLTFPEMQSVDHRAMTGGTNSLAEFEVGLIAADLPELLSTVLQRFKGTLIEKTV